MKTRKSRPLLRIATLTAGTMLVGCGSAQSGGPPDLPDPVEPPPPLQLPGNPKGSHYQEPVLLRAELEVDPSAVGPKVVTVVELRLPGEGEAVYARKQYPAGGIPQFVELTDADVTEAYRGAPAPMGAVVVVRVDHDGDLATTHPSDLGASSAVTIGREPVKLVLRPDAPPARKRKPKPVVGNPKGAVYDDGLNLRPKTP